MVWAKHQAVQIGDWVSGTSFLDERFIGYVESIGGNGTVKVFVTQSDHQEAIGEWVEGSLAKLDKLDDYVPNELSDLQSLMDLALMARDEAWFNELAGALRAVETNRNGAAPSGDKPYGSGNGQWTRRVKID
ncbi:hypothetical protein [Paenibacillus piri]|uniref:IDEAL domain-containing protein n=1 Tax=Paenibacillus piri TaxID=2547395 RepID=A0A4R5KLZ8_9BACL|nr:hypothetical protein [Paenibacillus piri]TDF95530.1 hypothetical protein E1757_20790 [Paenibacillus piri]